jgi:hypothetical protein
MFDIALDRLKPTTLLRRRMGVSQKSEKNLGLLGQRESQSWSGCSI